MQQRTSSFSFRLSTFTCSSFILVDWSIIALLRKCADCPVTPPLSLHFLFSALVAPLAYSCASLFRT